MLGNPCVPFVWIHRQVGYIPEDSHSWQRKSHRLKWRRAQEASINLKHWLLRFFHVIQKTLIVDRILVVVNLKRSDTRHRRPFRYPPGTIHYRSRLPRAFRGAPYRCTGRAGHRARSGRLGMLAELLANNHKSMGANTLIVSRRMEMRRMLGVCPHTLWRPGSSLRMTWRLTSEHPIYMWEEELQVTGRNLMQTREFWLWCTLQRDRYRRRRFLLLLVAAVPTPRITDIGR